MNRNVSAAGAHPFNHVAPMPPAAAQPRANSIFAKPAENKMPYNGRSNYPNQPPNSNKPDVSVCVCFHQRMNRTYRIIIIYCI